MTQNAHYGNVSRAMRNRVNEIYVEDEWILNERDAVGVLMEHMRHIDIGDNKRELVQFVYRVYRSLIDDCKSVVGMLNIYLRCVYCLCFTDTQLHVHAYDLLLAVQRACASLVGRNDFVEMITNVQNNEQKTWQRHPVLRDLRTTFFGRIDVIYI